MANDKIADEIFVTILRIRKKNNKKKKKKLIVSIKK